MTMKNAKKSGSEKVVKSAKAEKATKGAPAAKENSKESSKDTKAGKLEASAEIPVIDADELEEQEDAAAAASTGGNAAALAASAANPTEMSASFKNFRHHPDMENFYRFIFENDLRHEALAIIDEIIVQKQSRKLVKAAKGQAH